MFSVGLKLVVVASWRKSLINFFISFFLRLSTVKVVIVNCVFIRVRRCRMHSAARAKSREVQVVSTE